MTPSRSPTSAYPNGIRGLQRAQRGPLSPHGDTPCPPRPSAQWGGSISGRRSSHPFQILPAPPHRHAAPRFSAGIPVGFWGGGGKKGGLGVRGGAVGAACAESARRNPVGARRGRDSPHRSGAGAAQPLCGIGSRRRRVRGTPHCGGATERPPPPLPPGSGEGTVPLLPVSLRRSARPVPSAPVLGKEGSGRGAKLCTPPPPSPCRATAYGRCETQLSTAAR